METKVIYLVNYRSGESFETQLVEEARFAYESGADVLEIRTTDDFVGKVHVEVKTTYRWEKTK
ncbi:MAG: hypothetical protein J6K20_03170 [Thermoguttaceae bacterium]|nr:hypothetical protein [Thermoguttaceae bacterium]